MAGEPNAGDLPADRGEARVPSLLRVLLELTNEIVTARDLAAVLAAIAPHLQRVVPHDAANLYLMGPGGRQLGIYAISPRVVGGRTS